MPRTANQVKNTLKHFKDLFDAVTAIDLESLSFDKIDFLVPKKTSNVKLLISGCDESFEINREKSKNYLFNASRFVIQDNERGIFAILPQLSSEIIGRKKDIHLEGPEFRCEIVEEAFSLFQRGFFFEKPLSQTNVASSLPLLFQRSSSLKAEDFRIAVIFAILLTVYQTLVEAVSDMDEGQEVNFENNIILNPAARIQFQINNNPHVGKLLDSNTQLIMGLLTQLQRWHVCSNYDFKNASTLKEEKGLTYFDRAIEVLERENYLSGVQETYSSFASAFFQRLTTGRPGKEIDVQHLFTRSQGFRQAFGYLDKIGGRDKGNDLPGLKKIGIEVIHKEAFFIFSNANGIKGFFDNFFKDTTCPAHIYVLNYSKEIPGEELTEVGLNAYLNNLNGVNCIETIKRADKRKVGRNKCHQISKIVCPTLDDLPSLIAGLVWIGEQILELNKIESIDDDFQPPLLVSLNKGHGYLIGCAISLYVQKSEVEFLSDIYKKQDISLEEAQLYRLVLQMHAFKHINLLGNYFQTLKLKFAEDLIKFSKYDYASFENRKALHEKILSLRGTSSSNPTMNVSTLRLIQTWMKTLVLSNLFEPSVPAALTEKILEDNDVQSYAASFKNLLSILNEYIAFLGEKISLSTPEESAKEEWKNEVLYEKISKYGNVETWLNKSFNSDDISFIFEENVDKNLRLIFTLMCTIRSEIKDQDLELFSSKLKKEEIIIENIIANVSHEDKREYALHS